MNNVTMHDPDLISMLLEMYFGLTKKEKREPTLPGLALAIGFDTVNQVTATLKRWANDNTDYPEDSIRCILRALTQLEDHYLSLGIKGKIPPSLMKFIMGAYHSRYETDPNQNKQLPGGDTNFQIVFNAPEEFTGRTEKIASAKVTTPVVETPQALMVEY